VTTLGRELLQFITKTQEIFEANGEKFKHPLRKEIWNMVVKCKELRDGEMTIVTVPVNYATGTFDWKASQTTMEKANL
jgi:hypothetical protein